MMGISLLLVNVDSYRGFNPTRSYAMENNDSSTENKSVTKIEFGRTKDGQKVALYTLTNTNGLVAKITNYGAILTELQVPDNKGELDDVALGFDSLEDYFALPLTATYILVQLSVASLTGLKMLSSLLMVKSII